MINIKNLEEGRENSEFFFFGSCHFQLHVKSYKLCFLGEGESI